MERYRFIVFDRNKVNILNREFMAVDDDVAVRMAEGWRDDRGGQVWRAKSLVKHWKRGTSSGQHPATNIWSQS